MITIATELQLLLHSFPCLVETYFEQKNHPCHCNHIIGRFFGFDFMEIRQRANKNLIFCHILHKSKFFLQELEQAAAGVADAADAGVFCAEHIGLGVADEAGFLLVYSIRLAGFVDKARGGFPAGAGLAVLRESGLGVVGAVIEGVEVGADFLQFSVHPVVEAAHGALGEVAARDAALVGDDDGEVSGVVDVPDGLFGIWRPDEVLGPVEVVDVDVQRPVAVKEYGAALWRPIPLLWRGYRIGRFVLISHR